NPSSRYGTESEVSAAVAFLLSPAAAYINGVNLEVDGGSSLSKGHPEGHDFVYNPEGSLIPAYIGWPEGEANVHQIKPVDAPPKINALLENSVVLNLATKSRRASLVSLALNTTWLTKIGPDCILQIQEQSGLEFFSINCGVFGLSQASHFGQLLDAVNWYALKSLELTANNIDGWIELWAKCGKFTKLASFEIQFVRLNIVGSGGQETRLSHSSALGLHNVCLGNIEMQEARDWEMMRGAIDGTSS
ncbi:hypothetical protein CPC16_004023, partial [Podila verticillata]